MPIKFAVALLSLAVVFVIASQALFTVDEREQALVFQFGRPVGDVKGPGLHFKIPVIQDVRTFDARILSVDPPPEQMVISSSRDNPLVVRTPVGVPVLDSVMEPEDVIDGLSPEPAPRVVLPRDEFVSGEPIIVNVFARYRIVDPLDFMKTLQTVSVANQRIENIVNNATRSVLGQTTLRRLLSEERAQVMQDIKERVNRVVEADSLGIEIIDVRNVRADLTPELRQSTVRRMISELKERATETRARGEERALEISSTAERNRTVILADAGRDAQIIRGEGDQKAIAIYAKAFNRDPEFYAFMRSMEAYRNALADSETRMILSPDSDFFRFFSQSGLSRSRP